MQVLLQVHVPSGPWLSSEQARGAAQLGGPAFVPGDLHQRAHMRHQQFCLRLHGFLHANPADCRRLLEKAQAAERLRKAEVETPRLMHFPPPRCSGGYNMAMKEEKDVIVSSLLTVIRGCHIAESAGNNSAAALPVNRPPPAVARSDHYSCSYAISPELLPASDDLTLDFMLDSVLDPHWVEPLDLAWLKESTHTG